MSIKLAVLSLALALVAALAFAIVWIFPRKLRLIKRLGSETTNEQIIALAKSGDPEAAELFKISRIVFSVAIVSGFLLAILTHFLKK